MRQQHYILQLWNEEQKLDKILLDEYWHHNIIIYQLRGKSGMKHKEYGGVGKMNGYAYVLELTHSIFLDLPMDSSLGKNFDLVNNWVKEEVSNIMKLREL